MSRERLENHHQGNHDQGNHDQGNHDRENHDRGHRARMRCGRSVLLLAAAAALAGPAVPGRAADETAPFAERCARWIAKKGYSRDYVEQRIGKRPPERAAWQDNIEPRSVRKGDVVMLARGPGHVAVVEEVSYNADRRPARLRVTDWNFGVPPEDLLDGSCAVFRNFGVETTHWLPVTAIGGWWRPAE